MSYLPIPLCIEHSSGIGIYDVNLCAIVAYADEQQDGAYVRDRIARATDPTGGLAKFLADRTDDTLSKSVVAELSSGSVITIFGCTRDGLRSIPAQLQQRQAGPNLLVPGPAPSNGSMRIQRP